MEPVYYKKEMPDPNFCVDIFLTKNRQKGSRFLSHRHEYLQLYCLTRGKALLDCNGRCFLAEAGSTVIINSNELHCLESMSDDLTYYVIRIDSSFLFFSAIRRTYARQNIFSLSRRI